jgi:hypothetical protein
MLNISSTFKFSSPFKGGASFFSKNKIDLLVFLLLAIVNIFTFGLNSSKLGFYADDPSFLLTLGGTVDFHFLLNEIKSYVPGRNLHILWQYICIKIAGGGSLSDLPTLHFIQTSFDILNSWLLYTLLRSIKISFPSAFCAALLFALFPNHGETHFWPSALPMNLISTSLILVLMVYSASIFRGESFKTEKIFSLRWVTYWFVYIAAIFTYDQVVVVAFGSATLLLALLYKKVNKNGLKLLFLWALFFVTPILLIALLKLSAPGNGPNLGHFSASHMLLTVLYSLGIWVFVWIKFLFFPIFNIGSIETTVIALFIATASMLTLIYCFRNEKNVLSRSGSSQLNIRPVNFSKKYLLLLGVCFFMCAYLPNYIWSIASRHNYLPSIGVAIIIASLLDIFTLKASSSKIIKFVIIFALGLVSFNFSYLDILEKNFWIKSFEFRSALYGDLVKSPPKPSQKTLIFWEFPSSLYPIYKLKLPEGVSRYLRLMIGSIAPPPSFLFYEQPTAFSMYSKDLSRFEIISWHPIQTQEGFIIKNERRWGFDAMVFSPKSDVLRISYDKYKDYPALAMHSEPSKHVPGKISAPLKISSAPIDSEFSIAKDNFGYLISIPSVFLPKDFVLAIVPLANGEHDNAPAMSSDGLWNDEEYQLPIEIAAGLGNKNLEGTYRLPFSDRIPSSGFFKLVSIGPKGLSYISKTEIQKIN